MRTLVTIISVLVIIDQFFLWLERRGYLYWRKKKPTGGVACNALHEMKTFFEASSRVQIERRVDDTDSIGEKEKLNRLPYQY